MCREGLQSTLTESGQEKSANLNIVGRHQLVVMSVRVRLTGPASRRAGVPLRGPRIPSSGEGPMKRCARSALRFAAACVIAGAFAVPAFADGTIVRVTLWDKGTNVPMAMKRPWYAERQHGGHQHGH